MTEVYDGRHHPVMQGIISTMECRADCGACCIAPSISSRIPGMPLDAPFFGGKPAGVRCIHLDDDNRCSLYGLPERPAVCVSLKPSKEMCGQSRTEALEYLAELELLTRSEDPDKSPLMGAGFA